MQKPLIKNIIYIYIYDSICTYFIRENKHVCQTNYYVYMNSIGRILANQKMMRRIHPGYPPT